MRHIRFSPDMIEAIRRGKKTITFRRTPKPCGIYIVEEGGHPRHAHVDTGLRIFVFSTFWVECVDSAYALDYYKAEGFADPWAFIEKLKALYGFVPDVGFAHEFALIRSQSELEDLVGRTGGKKCRG